MKERQLNWTLPRLLHQEAVRQENNSFCTGSEGVTIEQEHLKVRTIRLFLFSSRRGYVIVKLQLLP
ncbi:hypothetical protein PAXRUDRAFT_565225 [Paxillus rubicundulus Ve08.2h10]|uniref:Uncharacterized protein n=1 Tax=Paxillus rubicundulus Ve08.2h10 TaxID=930991 RepID=A0A0D0DL02_9AGAM|nr:hypothetical protein PAXRUDRAFT_565225 [Paxillus rubicundulus Ve08.2h10]